MIHFGFCLTIFSSALLYGDEKSLEKESLINKILVMLNSKK